MKYSILLVMLASVCSCCKMHKPDYTFTGYLYSSIDSLPLNQKNFNIHFDEFCANHKYFHRYLFTTDSNGFFNVNVYAHSNSPIQLFDSIGKEMNYLFLPKVGINHSFVDTVYIP